MRPHRSLTLTKFIRVLTPDVVSDYLSRLDPGTPAPAWAHINGEVLERWLEDPANERVATIVREDFKRINDICTDGTRLLLRACKRDGVTFDDDLPVETVAFRLFLYHPDTFKYAWSRYLLYSGTSQLSIHAVSGGSPDFSDGKLEELRADLRRWFADQSKGYQCEVSYFDDEGESIVLLRHGTYLRAFPHWEGEQLGVSALRLALEDIMIFDRERGLIRVKASGERERAEYVRLFALHILGDESIAEAADKEEVFSLTPFQNGKFNYAGEGPIIRVQLRQIKMRLYGVTEPVIEIKAPDVAIAFEHDLGDLSLASGLLLSARLKFHIQYPGERATSRTFNINPPQRSNLPDRRDRELVLAYLERQGVILH